MRCLLKVFNPFIWCWNVFSHSAHLHHWAEMDTFARQRGERYEYKPYDFSKDVKYF